MQAQANNQAQWLKKLLAFMAFIGAVFAIFYARLLSANSREQKITVKTTDDPENSLLSASSPKYDTTVKNALKTKFVPGLSDPEKCTESVTEFLAKAAQEFKPIQQQMEKVLSHPKWRNVRFSCVVQEPASPLNTGQEQAVIYRHQTNQLIIYPKFFKLANEAKKIALNEQMIRAYDVLELYCKSLNTDRLTFSRHLKETAKLINIGYMRIQSINELQEKKHRGKQLSIAEKAKIKEFIQFAESCLLDNDSSPRYQAIINAERVKSLKAKGWQKGRDNTGLTVKILLATPHSTPDEYSLTTNQQDTGWAIYAGNWNIEAINPIAGDSTHFLALLQPADKTTSLRIMPFKVISRIGHFVKESELDSFGKDLTALFKRSDAYYIGKLAHSLKQISNEAGEYLYPELIEYLKQVARECEISAIEPTSKATDEQNDSLQPIAIM